MARYGQFPLPGTARADAQIAAGAQRCNGCGGSGIHPSDQAAVLDGSKRRDEANRCGACAGEGYWPARKSEG